MPRWSYRCLLLLLVLLAGLPAQPVLARAQARPLTPAGRPAAVVDSQSSPADVTILANGLTLASRTLPGLQTVSLAVAVRAGSRDESPSFQGGAHWVEHLLFLGSQKYPTQADLYAALGDATGFFNGYTDHETTSFVVTTVPAKLPAAVDILADMLLHPRFPPEDAERERQVLLTEIGDSSPSLAATEDRSLGEQLIGSVVLPPGGSTASIKSLTLDDAIAFKTLHYVARNMTVGVTGALSHQEVTDIVSQAFAGLPSGKPLITPLAAPVDSLHLTSDKGYAVIAGQRIPGLNSPDAAAIQVLDAILDEPGTRMSDAMDAGAHTFGGDTYIQLYSDAGYWRGLGAGDAGEVLQIVQEQLRRLQTEPVSDAELRAATRYLAGRTLLKNEYTSDQAVRLARLTLFGRYVPEEEEAARFLAVTAEDVQRAAQTYFNPDALSVIAPKPSMRANEGG